MARRGLQRWGLNISILNTDVVVQTIFAHESFLQNLRGEKGKQGRDVEVPVSVLMVARGRSARIHEIPNPFQGAWRCRQNIHLPP